MLNRLFSILLTAVLYLGIAVGAVPRQTDSPAASAPASAAETVQAITRLEEEFVRAALAADLPALERLWAADYQFTAPNGMLVTRDAYLAMLARKAVVYDRLALSGLKVRVFGDAATVTGRVDVHGKAIDHIVDGVDDFLTVYVKRDGRWQQVASHYLRVPGSTRTSGTVAAGSAGAGVR
jgi:hypothetical protein